MLKEMIVKNRSYRRFYEDECLTKETLLSLVDYARLSAPGANKQPLRYIVACDKQVNIGVMSSRCIMYLN